MKSILIAGAILLSCATAYAAPPRQLWLYYSTNFQSDPAVAQIEPIWRRAAKAGYTHILLTDSKFARLGDLQGMDRKYFGNLEKTKQLAAELKLELVPALFHIGYSNNMLWHDPNLAEGLPVRDSLFVVKGGEARLVPEPPVELKRPTSADSNIRFYNEVATVEDATENARFIFRLSLSPFRCYHASVQIKTDDFRGEPQVKALTKTGQVLQWQNLGVKRTQDWTEHHVIFNSLDYADINLYFGVWGGGKGKLQWKDWKIEEVGLLNVLRRPGTPCIVKGFVEGKDYEPIIDPLMGNKPYKGEYTSWHQPPVIKTKSIPDGTQLRVSWYHPAIIYDGQVSCCPSEPSAMRLMADEANRLKQAFGAAGYMMSHDEVRTLNWDQACMARNLDAGQILAENVKQCRQILAGSKAYVWSDMFDPHHNAKDNYYLVRGSLKGSWEGLDRDVIIMNWNFGKRDDSLKFFAERGHQQIIAGYYDDKPEKIKDWLKSAENVQGVIGVMYTTWVSNYNDIEAFAQQAR